MTVSKKFLEAVSKDKALNAEVDKATLEALGAFLKAKGLEDEAAKAAEAAMEKIAEAHGFKAEAMEAVSADELEAVAGGGCVCCFRGTGNLLGDRCKCGTCGTGDHYPHGYCKCTISGAGGGESNNR